MTTIHPLTGLGVPRDAAPFAVRYDLRAHGLRRQRKKGRLAYAEREPEYETEDDNALPEIRAPSEEAGEGAEGPHTER